MGGVDYLVDNEHEYESEYKADSNDMWNWILFMLISVIRLLSAFSVMMALLDARKALSNFELLSLAPVSHVEGLHALGNDHRECGAHKQTSAHHGHQLQLLFAEREEERDGAGDVAAQQHHQGHHQHTSETLHCSC